MITHVLLTSCDVCACVCSKVKRQLQKRPPKRSTIRTTPSFLLKKGERQGEKAQTKKGGHLQKKRGQRSEEKVKKKGDGQKKGKKIGRASCRERV